MSLYCYTRYSLFCHSNSLIPFAKLQNQTAFQNFRNFAQQHPWAYRRNILIIMQILESHNNLSMENTLKSCQITRNWTQSLQKKTLTPDDSRNASRSKRQKDKREISSRLKKEHTVIKWRLFHMLDSVAESTTLTDQALTDDWAREIIKIKKHF